MARTYVEKIIRDKKLAAVDAKAGTTVVITQSDVVSAKAKNSKCCAFSLAARRKPGVVGAYFFLTTAYLEYKDQIVRYKLPPLGAEGNRQLRPLEDRSARLVPVDASAAVDSTGSDEEEAQGGEATRGSEAERQGHEQARPTGRPAAEDRQDCGHGSGQRHAGAASVRQVHRACRGGREACEASASHRVRPLDAGAALVAP